jgi:hypothetical protein
MDALRACPGWMKEPNPDVHILTIAELSPATNSATVAWSRGIQESRSRGCERWKGNTAAALAATPMFDMIIFVAWSGAMFGLGFAAGWLARRRLVGEGADAVGACDDQHNCVNGFNQGHKLLGMAPGR